MIPRSFVLVSERVQKSLITVISNLPLDGSIEAVLRPLQRKRSNEANALMWLRLGEIAAQAWVMGAQYSAETWHEHYKRQYLPEDGDQDIDRRVKGRYRKWAYLPNGDRVLVGSTTNLTKWGFSEYMTQIEADGAGMGVLFSSDPRYAQAQAAA